MSYTQTERTAEIGVRMALGAQRFDILCLIMGEAMKLVAIGCAAGVLLGLALNRLMSSVLFGISPQDPATFMAGGVVLTVVALLACWIPARRATRVDPLIALRHE
jgi:putative ABC transport system permease protein